MKKIKMYLISAALGLLAIPVVTIISNKNSFANMFTFAASIDPYVLTLGSSNAPQSNIGLYSK